MRRPLPGVVFVASLIALVISTVGIPTSPLAAAPPPSGSRSAGVAVVRYIYHGLTVRPPGGSDRRGQPRMPLFSQYGLRTHQNEKASIRFHDGTVLHLNMNTDAVLSSPHITRISHGEVAEYLAPGSDHQVQTATAIASAIGTTFDVRVDETRTTIVVLYGALHVTNAGGTVTVKRNHETVVTLNRPPENPFPVDATAAFAWTAGIPTPDLGEDVALDANGGSVLAFSSQRTDAGDRGRAYHINDGLLTQGWETATGRTANQSITIGFFGGNFYRISGVIIDPAATNGSPNNEDLKDFAIRVSSTGTDDASFTTVFRGTCTQEDRLQPFPFPVPLRAKYVQLVALTNYGSRQRIAVAEMEVVATASLFARPTGIAADSSGNVYVTDSTSNRVVKLSPHGKILAQWGRKGDRPGEFKRPESLTIDKHGNVYVADSLNHRIQKLSPTGRPLAQWGSSGLKSGQFLFPHGVALDSQGNIYVTDTMNRIQKLSPSGKVLAVWSDLGSAGTLSFPEGIALDHKGNVYIADSGHARIVVLSPSGKLMTVYGKPGTQRGEFKEPSSVAVDAVGNIYVTDSYNNRVQKIDPQGHFTSWGAFGTGPGQFSLPLSVVAAPSGQILVADTGNSRIQVLTPGGKVRSIWGKYATVPQVLGEPAGVATDVQGNVYITDDLNDRIQQRSRSGRLTAVFGYHGNAAMQRGKSLGQFWYPHGIAVDRRGILYVADTFNSRVELLSTRGPIRALGSHGKDPGQFVWPEAVALDSRGNIWVADTGNNRIQKISPNGAVLGVFGSYGTDPGKFFFPQGIAVDHQDNVYVADSFNNRIQKLSSSGQVLAVWGQTNLTVENRFFDPIGLTVDAHDHLYVADSGHNSVQELSPDGKVLQLFILPGPNPSPVSVAVDNNGKVYAADSLGSRIVTFAPTGEVVDIWN